MAATQHRNPSGHSLSLALLFSLSFACATGVDEGSGAGEADAGFLGGGNGDGDGDGAGAADASSESPDADGFGGGADAAPGSDAAPEDPRLTITHNVDTDTIATEADDDNGAFVGCYALDDNNDPLAHAALEYFKVFDLEGDFNVTEDVILEDFRMGVLEAAASDGSIEMTLTLSHQADSRNPDPANADEIVSINTALPTDGSIDFPSSSVGLDLTDLENFDGDVVVPAGRSLLVELSIGDGLENDELFLIGVNFEGEDRGNGSFVRAEPEACDLQSITAFRDVIVDETSLGDRKWVMKLEGVKDI